MIEVDCKPFPKIKEQQCMNWINHFRFITRSFGKTLDIKDIPYIDMVEEMLSDKPINHTKYYAYLMNLWANNNRCVWGYIKTKEDVLSQALKFRELAKDIQKNGFDADKNEVSIKNNLPYGKITFIRENNQTAVLIDGHHRISVLLYLGIRKFEMKDNYLIPVLNENLYIHSNQ